MSIRCLSASLLSLAVTIFVAQSVEGGTTRYVSPSGAETGGYTTWATAAKTIQKAVDACSNGDAVWVTNGIYSITSHITLTNGVTVMGLGGASGTTIDGGNTSRGFYLSHSNAIVDGFYIRNGRSGGGRNSGGGVLIDFNGLVRNCVISNCVASWGGGVSLYRGGAIRNCLIVSNTVSVNEPGGGVDMQEGGSVENCTIVGNQATFGAGVSFNNGGDYRVINSIICGNVGGDNVGYYHASAGDISFSCFTPYIAGTGNITNNPLFTSGFRLSPGSPCVDTGTNLTWMVVATDLDGNPRIAGTTVDIGAYEFTGASDTTPPANVSSFTVTPGNAQVGLSWANPADGDFAGVKILRKIGGYATNTSDGTVVHNGMGTSTTDTGLVNGTPYYYKAFSFDGIPNYASGSTATATPQAPGPATVRYVSPSGSETGGYTNWATAAKTIQKAVTVCNDGDSVLVTNGIYSTTSQVSVIKGITVSSVNGATATIIDGGGWTFAGTNRCLYISHSNAVVEGFTIRNGYSEQDGAGVLILSNGLIRNSIIYSNTVHYQDGGGVALIDGGTVRNCLIVSNYNDYAGSYGWGGGVYIENNGNVENCTVAYNSNPQGAGIRANGGGRIINSIVKFNSGSSDIGGNGAVTYSCMSPLVTGTGNITNNPLFTSGFRLSPGSPCVEAGTNLAWMVGATDLDGNPRIAGATVDMGTYEKIPSVLTITVLTDRASVTIPEGGSTNFQVKLSSQPAGDTLVTVARTAGDTDISVSIGGSLTFSTANWATYQTVTLAAAEDNGDNANDTATVTCSGVGITQAVVTATEADDDYTLTVNAVNGSVSKAPNTPYYDNGSSVSLTATQNAGYHFTGWSGATTGTNNPVNVTVTNNLSVTANFVLNVITVMTDRASISVPEGGLTNFLVKLSAQPTGATVVVVARTSGDTDIIPTAGTNLTFTTNNSSAYQTVTMSAAEDNGDNSNGVALITCSAIGVTQAVVTATEIDDDYTLAVVAANGTVDKVPDTPFYDSGSSVGLTAIPNAGYHFTGWSGDTTGSTNTVSLTLNGNKSVTASFALNVITVLTDRASVSVSEGGSTNFQVKLSAQPTGDTVVAVARTAGDTDISFSSGSSLTFSTGNWASFQTVTLTAAEDDGDNVNGIATITCSGSGLTLGTVEATEVDDDYTLTVTSLYGTVTRNPDTPYYDNGTTVNLTAIPSPAYYFMGYTGDLTDTNNPATITMAADKSVTANYGAAMPAVLPPSKIAKKSFTARWKWVEGGAPEGELSVVLNVGGFPQFVPGYETRYVVNSPECLVTNLLAGKEYWYRVRRLMPDGRQSSWSSQMKVRTGDGISVFKNLLSDVPVSKGISQEFAFSNLVSGAGTLAVKSSNTNAVKATVSSGALTLQYLWKTADAAKVTLTLTHPATGYKASYVSTVGRAGGSVAILSHSALTNAGTVVAQEVTLENRTGGRIYGVRVRALGLNQQDWLINRTGVDPLSKAAIREMPCVLPAGSQMVVRLVYNIAYKKQAKTDPVAYGAWAIMTPVHGALPVTGDMAVTQQALYDGLWLLGMPANRNRLYTVYHSDDSGATWMLNVPVIRATGNYLMWLDTDEGALAGRIYRMADAGM